MYEFLLLPIIVTLPPPSLEDAQRDYAAYRYQVLHEAVSTSGQPGASRNPSYLRSVVGQLDAEREQRINPVIVWRNLHKKTRSLP